MVSLLYRESLGSLCTHVYIASTCFGNSLSVLARLPGPIRNLKGPGDLLPEKEPMNGSREIQKLVAWLNIHEAEHFVSFLVLLRLPWLTIYAGRSFLDRARHRLRRRYSGGPSPLSNGGRSALMYHYGSTYST